MKPSQICKNLRSKSMFVTALAEAQTQAGEPVGRASHCWCNCTLTETGPDDRPVGPQVCDPARPCFED